MHCSVTEHGMMSLSFQTVVQKNEAKLSCLDRNHFVYFHPSKRDCSRLKGACQRHADTGQPSKGSKFVY